MTFEKMRERRKFSYEHPVESGDIIGELFITVVLAMAFSILLARAILENLIFGYLFSVFVLGVTILNCYLGIYKPMRRLERELYKKK